MVLADHGLLRYWRTMVFCDTGRPLKPKSSFGKESV
jgi:hypothetical protein